MGNFPSGLKFSIVNPIYKAGDKQNLANFRPIFLKGLRENYLFKNM
jgi:hypothetical protein